MDSRDLELLKAIQLMIDPLANKIDKLETDMEGLKYEVRKTNLVIENEIKPNLRLTMEAQSDLYHKVKDIPEEIADIKESVSILKFVQQEMAKKNKS